MVPPPAARRHPADPRGGFQHAQLFDGSGLDAIQSLIDVVDEELSRRPFDKMRGQSRRGGHGFDRHRRETADVGFAMDDEPESEPVDQLDDAVRAMGGGVVGDEHGVLVKRPGIAGSAGDSLVHGGRIFGREIAERGQVVLAEFRIEHRDGADRLAIVGGQRGDDQIGSGHWPGIQDCRGLDEIVLEQGGLVRAIGMDGPQALHVERRLVHVLPASEQQPSVRQHRWIEFRLVVDGDRFHVAAIRVHGMQGGDMVVEAHHQAGGAGADKGDAPVRQVAWGVIVDAGAVQPCRLFPADAIGRRLQHLPQAGAIDADAIDGGVAQMHSLEGKQHLLAIERQIGIPVDAFAQRLPGLRINDRADHLLVDRGGRILENVDAAARIPGQVVVIDVRREIGMPFHKQQRRVQLQQPDLPHQFAERHQAVVDGLLVVVQSLAQDVEILFIRCQPLFQAGVFRDGHGPPQAGQAIAREPALQLVDNAQPGLIPLAGDLENHVAPVVGGVIDADPGFETGILAVQVVDDFTVGMGEEAMSELPAANVQWLTVRAMVDRELAPANLCRSRF